MTNKNKFYDEGIVLSYYSYKENDKIVNVFTKNNGRMSLLARGAMKPSSNFGGKIEPITRIEFLYSVGRGFPFMSEVKELSPYLKIKSSIKILKQSLVLIEILKKMYPEEKKDVLLYKMSKRYIDILNMDGVTKLLAEFLILSFKLNVLNHEGLNFSIDICNECGNTKSRFSMSASGEILCSRCIGNRNFTSVEPLRNDIEKLKNLNLKGITDNFNENKFKLLKKIINLYFSLNTGVELLTEKMVKLKL